MKPSKKPANPNFSSGPCSKYPGYNISQLTNALLGRSHRSAIAKKQLKFAIDQTTKILNLPNEYLVGIVPGSDTGAFEMALWNLIGKTGVDVIHFESFGSGWFKDIVSQLKIYKYNSIEAEYGYLPDLNCVNFDNDVVFTWNGTTSGVKIPDGSWIPDDRKGLTIVDATSAVFAMDIPWTKIDVATFSWQKVLGGEAAHGMLILSPKAVERINNYTPAWPIPKLMQLRKANKIDYAIFEGSTINTPSMLCVEDYLLSLKWAESIGGLAGLIERSASNLCVVENFVEKHNWINFLAKEKEYRSNTAVCLTVDIDEGKLGEIIKFLSDEKIAYDIASYKDAPKGLRFWCGATVEKEDLETSLKWLEWAYNKYK